MKILSAFIEITKEGDDDNEGWLWWLLWLLESIKRLAYNDIVPYNSIYDDDDDDYENWYPEMLKTPFNTFNVIFCVFSKC